MAVSRKRMRSIPGWSTGKDIFEYMHYLKLRHRYYCLNDPIHECGSFAHAVLTLSLIIVTDAARSSKYVFRYFPGIGWSSSFFAWEGLRCSAILTSILDEDAECVYSSPGYAYCAYQFARAQTILGDPIFLFIFTIHLPGYSIEMRLLWPSSSRPCLPDLRNSLGSPKAPASEVLPLGGPLASHQVMVTYHIDFYHFLWWHGRSLQNEQTLRGILASVFQPVGDDHLMELVEK
jgi:hypothetical protein